MHTMV